MTRTKPQESEGRLEEWEQEEEDGEEEEEDSRGRRLLLLRDGLTD